MENLSLGFRVGGAKRKRGKPVNQHWEKPMWMEGKRLTPTEWERRESVKGRRVRFQGEAGESCTANE